VTVSSWWREVVEVLETALVPERDLAFARVHDSVDLVRPRHPKDNVDGLVERKAECANVGSVARTQR
jgi:hypothetical protein